MCIDPDRDVNPPPDSDAEVDPEDVNPPADSDAEVDPEDVNPPKERAIHTVVNCDPVGAPP
jgi:hypothetical protein